MSISEWLQIFTPITFGYQGIKISREGNYLFVTIYFAKEEASVDLFIHYPLPPCGSMSLGHGALWAPNFRLF